MKRETKEYIDQQLGELANVLRKEAADTAQAIHERIGQVQQELAEVKRHTDDHCHLDGFNAYIADALNADIARRLDVLDKLAGISSKSPQLDAELETLNREYDAATARANNPLGSLLDFLTNGPGQSGGPSILGGIFRS